MATICARVDGIPLALEMAAAALASALALDELAVQLEDSLSVLTGGSRAALPRQQTLRATMDWSHALLSEPEQVLFRRLSVFSEGSPPRPRKQSAPDRHRRPETSPRC